jgi:hypothetical protein
VKSGVKEEIMKKFIYITVSSMLMLIFTGCFATMTPEQHKETYDLRKNMGNAPFVGDHYDRDEWGNITTVPRY